MTDDLRLRISICLTSIVSMYSRLHDEATHQRVNEAGLYIPGGDALNMLGPAANLEAWQHRYETLEDAGFGPHQDYVYDQIDVDDHPLLVLAGWEDVIRDHRNQPSDLKATVNRAADYIRGQLDWLIGYSDHDTPNFLPIDALVADLRRVRARLERLLHDGEQVDRGVPCMKCGEDLVKVWGVNEDTDRWHCKACHEWSTPEQYHQAVKYDYMANSDKLTATHMEEQYRVKPGTLRKWASDGDVRKRGKDDSGRTLYDVEDTLKMRDGDKVDKVS